MLFQKNTFYGLRYKKSEVLFCNGDPDDPQPDPPNPPDDPNDSPDKPPPKS